MDIVTKKRLFIKQRKAKIIIFLLLSFDKREIMLYYIVALRQSIAG